MKKKAVWKKIGFVGVDSGTLMIIDPCYAIGFSNKDYEKEVVQTAQEKVHPVKFDLGHFGKAVIFSSGIGDGCYDVYGKFEILKDWGERITEVRIVMDIGIKKATKHFFGDKK